ncbi:hypothetical protein BH24ACT11_BH24ACT11_06620 [soil metagenome]
MMIGLAGSTAIFMALTQEKQVSAMPWWALALGVFLRIGAGTVPQERLPAASVRRTLLAIAAMLVTVLAVLVALHPSRIAAGLPPARARHRGAGWLRRGTVLVSRKREVVADRLSGPSSGNRLRGSMGAP